VTKRRRYLGACLLLVTFCCGACTGKQVSTETQTTAQDSSVQDKQQEQDATIVPYVWQHGFDKTEVDLEYGRPQPASRYHLPRVRQRYTFDGTETDLSKEIKKINPSLLP
jgi:hypothetical protein